MAVYNRLFRPPGPPADFTERLERMPRHAIGSADPGMVVQPPGGANYTLRDDLQQPELNQDNTWASGWLPAGYDMPTMRVTPGAPAPQTWQLTPQGEALYQQQAGPRAGDTADYDLRGAWAQQGGGDLGNAHLTDTWKLPNHPTFSAQSRYQTPTQPGGSWAQLPGGQWAFVPSETNMQNLGSGGMRDYFDRVEPNALLIPGAQGAPRR